MEGLKDGLKTYMEDLKEGLTKFLQEMLHNGEKVFHETHDDNKMNVSHDFRDYKFALKTNQFKKTSMRKFGKD